MVSGTRDPRNPWNRAGGQRKARERCRDSQGRSMRRVGGSTVPHDHSSPEACGAIDPMTSKPDTQRFPSRRVQMTRARFKSVPPVCVVMRRSHTVPAASQWSSESCMPVLLTSTAEATCWIGDKMSTSASESHRSARRRSSLAAAGRTSELLGIGGGLFEGLRLLEFMLPAESGGQDSDLELHHADFKSRRRCLTHGIAQPKGSSLTSDLRLSAIDVSCR